MNPNLGYLTLAAALLALGFSALALTRSSAEPPRDEPGPAPRSRDAEMRDLAARIAKLEQTETDPRVRTRLDDLERRLTSLPGAPDAVAEIPDAPVVDAPTAAPVPDGEPDDAEIERFRKLQEAVARQNKIRQYSARIGGALKKAGVELTEEENEKLVTTFIAFEKRRQDVWGEIKRSNPAETEWPRIILETSEMLNREFSQQITTFIPGASVQTVAQTLVPIREIGRK